MHLILKESLFRSDSSVKIRFYDIEKDHEVVVTKDIDNTDYKVLSRGIVDALKLIKKPNYFGMCIKINTSIFS